MFYKHYGLFSKVVVLFYCFEEMCISFFFCIKQFLFLRKINSNCALQNIFTKEIQIFTLFLSQNISNVLQSNAIAVYLSLNNWVKRYYFKKQHLYYFYIKWFMKFPLYI